MEGPREAFSFLEGVRDPRFSSRVSSCGFHILLLLASLGFGYVVLTRMGMQVLVLALVGLFIGSIYAVISFRSLLVPFIIWVLSVGGFRYIWSIQTPVLPDLLLDRMMMIWLSLVFMVKFFATGRGLRNPSKLDFLLLANGIYLLIRVYMTEMEFIHSWTMSYLTPYVAYFFAKNIVTTMKRVRITLWALLGLTVYYGITSVAEKFGLDYLIYPKIISSGASHFVGRSSGPFLHAPLFGTILGMLIPLHLYFISTVKNQAAKAALVISFVVGIAGLYFTYTRGSWLAGVVAMIVVAVTNGRSYLKILVPSLVLVPLLAFTVLGVGQDQFMKERVENDDTLGSRVGTAMTALKIWRDNPFFGVGFFQYRYARNDYIQPISVPGLGTIRYIQFRHNNIHDIYLGPLAEDGLFGAFLQGSIYLLILKRFLSRYKGRRRGDPFAIYVLPIFAGIFAGYFVGGLAIDYRFFAFVGTLFYMSAGILEGYQMPEQHDVS